MKLKDALIDAILVARLQKLFDDLSPDDREKIEQSVDQITETLAAGGAVEEYKQENQNSENGVHENVG